MLLSHPTRPVANPAPISLPNFTSAYEKIVDTDDLICFSDDYLKAAKGFWKNRFMQQWKTGEVAQLLNVTKRTLQNWLEQEKIPRPQKGANGYYVWSTSDVKAAQNYLQRLKSTTRYRLRGQDK